MSSPPLAPPGSSTYKSDTMTVGDGTWDSSKNTFLLPNLVGLNFDTMRYNGMGNRFRQQPGYHNLIQAHGILAAITFIFIVPVSIFLSRFYRRRTGIRLHIWLSVLTLILTIVIFALGNSAVGPSRRYSNPHHGIGLAIFIMVLFEFFQGWWVHRKDWRKKQSYEPMGITLHNWLGWAIALLALAQVPLGLTLYGAPKVLFILYALAAFVLLLLLFVLVRREKRLFVTGTVTGTDYDSRYDSYGPGSVVEDHRKRKGTSGWLQSALAAAGLYALWQRFRGKREIREERPLPPTAAAAVSHGRSDSYVDDEKYSYSSDGVGKWEDRLLRIAAPIGLAGLVTRYFDRRYGERGSDISSYAPPHGGQGPYTDSRPPPLTPTGVPVQNSPGYVAPGPYASPHALPSERHPLNRTHSRESSWSSSHPSAAAEVRRSHSLRDGIATLGAIGFAKNTWGRWRDRREDRRLEAERNARLQGSRFTGDGHRPGGHQHGVHSTSSLTSLSATHPQTTHGIPPLPAGTYAAGTAGAAAVAAEQERERERERRNQEALPLGGVPRPMTMPAMPLDPQGVLHRESSSSVSYSSAGDVDRRHQNTLAPGAPPPLAPELTSTRRDRQERHQSLSPGEDSGVTSPPVSVRVKMHKDGRHVTLSRLPEAEAEARKARNRHNHGDSISSLSADGGAGSSFRRRDTQDRQNAEAMRIESERLAAARNEARLSGAQPATPANLAPPPPIPESSGSARPSPLAGSVGSPGNYETDYSTDYANNRRRRRAERARAKQAKEEREARTGKTVGFE